MLQMKDVINHFHIIISSFQVRPSLGGSLHKQERLICFHDGSPKNLASYPRGEFRPYGGHLESSVME